MKRRRTAPVVEVKSPDTSELRRERAEAIAELRRLEWEFDKGPTFDRVAELRSKRVELTDIEDAIALVTEEVAASKLLERAEAVRANGLLERIGELAQ